jgi:hypothetical protein
MLQDAHKTRAEDIERDIPNITSGSYIIEGYWGAAFNWIAYSCERKHGQHREKHDGLVGYLRTLNKGQIADAWEALENVCIGAWYGTKTDDPAVQKARHLWQEIRTRALS